jgi:hypothetical protein
MWRCARRPRVTDGNSGEQRGNEQDLPEHLLFVPVPRALRKGRSPGPACGNVTRGPSDSATRAAGGGLAPTWMGKPATLISWPGMGLTACRRLRHT